MKVALIAGTLQAGEDSTFALDLAIALGKRGIEVTVLGGEGPLLRRFAEAGIPARGFPLSGSVFTDLAQVPDLLKALREERPDLLHGIEPDGHRLVALLAALARCPWFLYADYVPRTPLPRLGTRFRGVILPGNALEQELVLRRRTPRKHLFTVPPGVDAARFADPPEPLGDGTPVIGTVAPLVSGSGVEELVRAAHQLIEEGRDLQFLIAGRGPMADRLRRLARDLAIASRVTVTSVPGSFEQVFSAIDVFVYPGTRGSLGQGILQAMAAGRPVLAWGTGGAFTLVRENETGFLVSRGDANKLAERLRWLLDRPDRARALGRAGRERVEASFRISRTAEAVARVYRDEID